MSTSEVFWWVYRFLGRLGSEVSLYDSYILFDGTGEVLRYFLCFVLGGLFATLFLRHPKKEGA